MAFVSQLLEKNIRLKLSSRDCADRDAVKALQVFAACVDMHAKTYEPLGSIDEDRGHSFCQMMDAGRKLILHNATGFLPS